MPIDRSQGTAAQKAQSLSGKNHIDKWAKKQLITADKLNKSIDQINSLSQHISASNQVRRNPATVPGYSRPTKVRWRQEGSDLPADEETFAPTTLWGETLRLVKINWRKTDVDGTFKIQLMIDDVLVGKEITETDDEEIYITEWTEEQQADTIYDDDKKLTLQVTESDGVEELEVIAEFI